LQECTQTTTQSLYQLLSSIVMLTCHITIFSSKIPI
jgi:hypothetical protein